ncbi:MAG TPA: hypothetical protein VFQ88_04450 [Nevskiaceae bacterium]|nr:hypothetical protein [Nevskiaceae bacterium]
MPDVINVHEAKTHLSRLLDRAHAGEQIVRAKAGKSYARLVPLPRRGRTLGFLKGCELDDSFFDPLPDEELGLWEG